MMNTMIELALENLRYSTPNLTDNERYVNVKNRPIPSVTEIIPKMVHSDTLMRWSNSIGLKGIVYDKYMEEASSFGTKAHACIERYIKLKEKTDSNIPFRGFMLWYNTRFTTRSTKLVSRKTTISFTCMVIFICFSRFRILVIIGNIFSW